MHRFLTFFRTLSCIVASLSLCFATGQAHAQRAHLPQDHEYQRVLRSYMATLTEKDFDHGVTDELTVTATNMDSEQLFRTYIMTKMHQPLVGWKRGTPAVNAPSWLFLLSNIEGPLEGPTKEEITAGFELKPGPQKIRPTPIPVPTGIVIPPVWPETLVAFTQWDYPGNPFYNNRALKLRAFVTAAARMMMLDQHFDQVATSNRSDWNAYKLVTFASTYMGVKDLLPPEVREAYKTGVLRFGRRILEWGVRGEEPNLDMTMPIGLWYAAQVCDDAQFAQQAQDFARNMMTDPASFHPAGYWVERGGGLDVGFGGMANFFAIWTALASDWSFARENVVKAYRLRGHLSLPEPDGTFNGPSGFNSRIGTPACKDEWHWDGARNLAAFMITDEAADDMLVPTEEQLQDAPANRVNWFNQQIYGSLRNPYNSVGHHYGYFRNEDLRGHTWSWRMWDTYNFPATLNPGYEFYKTGSYAHLQQLQKQDSPLLKSPYLRGENFVRNFADAFIAVRQPDFAAILHTGPVGLMDPNDGLVQFKGPMGFGGGELAAFWTPKTGSVWLNRRSGMNYDKSLDDMTKWQLLPIHAVSGTTAAGKIFTTGRIIKPQVTSDLQDHAGSVTVSGVIPASMLNQGDVLTGELQYTRKFQISKDAVKVTTTLKGDGKDTIAELYETLPIFLRDTREQAKATPTAIAFQVGGKWQPATAEPVANVTAIRLTRFDGAVKITFDQPQLVKLSPEDWNDVYITRAACRNVLIDLSPGRGKPAPLKGEVTVSYTIAAMPQ